MNEYINEHSVPWYFILFMLFVCSIPMWIQTWVVKRCFCLDGWNLLKTFKVVKSFDDDDLRYYGQRTQIDWKMQLIGNCIKKIKYTIHGVCMSLLYTRRWTEYGQPLKIIKFAIRLKMDGGVLMPENDERGRI